MTHSIADRCRRYFLTTCATIAMVLLGLVWAPWGSAQEADGKIPGLLDTRALQIEAIEAMYVTELQGSNASFKAMEPDKFRALVLTLRVTKPADTPLRLYAADLALHYIYGDNFDVIPCMGLSTFSASQNVDRPMVLADRGYLSAATSGQTQKASVIYLDAFFQGLEAESRDVHLLVARPTGSMLRTTGWTATGTSTPNPAKPSNRRDPAEGMMREAAGVERMPLAWGR